MRKSFRKYFIPEEANNHKPHFLRGKSLLFIVACFLVLEIALFVSAFPVFRNSDFFAAVLPSVLVSLTNENRASLKAPALTENALLVRAAELKAKDMAAKGYFAHTSPEGVTPWFWLSEVGYSYTFAGENLAVNFIDSKDVSDAWMKSPSHRTNVLNARFKEVGIATARGIYKGQEAVFVVQFFGEPSPVVSPAQAKASSALLASASAAPAKISVPIVSAPSPAPSAVKSPAVKGESVERLEVRPPFVKLLASPRTAVATLLLLWFMLLVVALALAVLIKIKIQHRKMIAGTLLVIFLVLGILYLNSKIFTGIAEVPGDNANYAAAVWAF